MLLFKNKFYNALDPYLYPPYHTENPRNHPADYFIPTRSHNTFHSVLDFLFKNPNPNMQSALNNVVNSTAQAFQTAINTTLANSGINLALVSTQQNSQPETSSAPTSKNYNDTNSIFGRKSQNEHSEKESSTEQKSNSKSKNQNLRSRIISFLQNGNQESNGSQKSNEQKSKQKKNK